MAVETGCCRPSCRSLALQQARVACRAVQHAAGHQTAGPPSPLHARLVLQAAADVLLSRVEEAKKVPTVLMGEIRCARGMAP